MTTISKIHIKGKQESQYEACPECGNPVTITDTEGGEVVCNRCGLVLKERDLDQKPEWRAYTLEERADRSRTGLPTTLTQYDKGLSTTFRTNEDARGKSLPSKTRFEMMRLNQWNTRSRLHSSAERNLSQAMVELERLCDKLNLPQSTREEAALTYRRALKLDLIRGRSIVNTAAAAVYTACRITRTPRRLEEITLASGKSRKEISRSYRLLQKEIGFNAPIDDPMKYMPKIASEVGLGQQTQNKANEILQKAISKKASTGKDPVGIAAAALYIASIMEGDKVTQKELANASGMTEVTVRNRYKTLAKDLGMKDIYYL